MATVISHAKIKLHRNCIYCFNFVIKFESCNFFIPKAYCTSSENRLKDASFACWFIKDCQHSPSWYTYVQHLLNFDLEIEDLWSPCFCCNFDQPPHWRATHVLCAILSWTPWSSTRPTSAVPNTITSEYHREYHMLLTGFLKRFPHLIGWLITYSHIWQRQTQERAKCISLPPWVLPAQFPVSTQPGRTRGRGWLGQLQRGLWVRRHCQTPLHSSHLWQASSV